MMCALTLTVHLLQSAKPPPPPLPPTEEEEPRLPNNKFKLPPPKGRIPSVGGGVSSRPPSETKPVSKNNKFKPPSASLQSSVSDRVDIKGAELFDGFRGAGKDIYCPNVSIKTTSHYPIQSCRPLCHRLLGRIG